MAFQQVENLCEEQIDVLQELRGEIIGVRACQVEKKSRKTRHHISSN